MSGPVADQAQRRVVPVIAGEARYEVVIGPAALDDIAALLKPMFAGATRIALIADAGLPQQRIAQAQANLGALGPVATMTIVPSEPEKSMATAERVLSHLATAGLERSGGLVVALGGGVVGDIAGFAAATYRRGVPVVQCPTTLLAMVDASVGGKTGVNLAVTEPGGRQLRKNFVGCFHQPAIVIADISTLVSLDERDFRCGLAECLKHGLVAADWGDQELFDWTVRNLPRIRSHEPEALTDLVARNVAVKAAIVRTDVRETGPAGRMLLNLGHTFAHAVETIEGVSPSADPGLAPLRHGEAVAVGLIAACRLSQRLGLAPGALGDEVRSALEAAGLPLGAWGLPPSVEIARAMAHDKKAARGRLRMVAPLEGRRARIVEAPPARAIEEALDAVRPADS